MSLRRMSLRRRLALMAAASVAVAVVLASVVAYVAVRNELRSQVDEGLRSQASRIERGIAILQGRLPDSFPAPGPRGGTPPGAVQVIGPNGDIVRPAPFEVPVPGPVPQVAAGETKTELRDEHADGVHLRVLTLSVGRQGAVQLASSLESTDHVLDRLRTILVLICLAGIGVAAVLSRLVTRAVLAPITDLTEAAEHVTQTSDLSRRIEGGGDDEVGRMAFRFNRMLDSLEASRSALDASVATQRQLVADASHELRTPITSLRTNIEVLLDDQPLGAEERAQLLHDVRGQSEELSELITDVIELARGEEPATHTQEVALDAVVGEAVERARRHAPGVTFVCALEPSVVQAVPERVGRAVNNLLDNAAKYGPPGSEVDVRVAGGVVSVRDHGPGIDEADLPHVFERFYRGASARGEQGSGLGLAIVRQVAVSHGGTVAVENAPGGGAVFRLVLPVR
jgi:two-component system, OmpR family, sensor histidine kinase MprB